MEVKHETTTIECIQARHSANVVARGKGLVGGGELGTWIASSLLLNDRGVT